MDLSAEQHAADRDGASAMIELEAGIASVFAALRAAEAGIAPAASAPPPDWDGAALADLLEALDRLWNRPDA